ncbi:phosphate regulon sensor histidine kinase PhoR [Steroidobacter sp.]|uniref:phosphate regulon sensor histidine kinase PhoR n=1 Tax=Steroidobacter sp. TaxID=1978227 RepID=UPI001A37E10D|nr:phosphate regulon sensor histidine kinase PhoR [Steroidobacter sp.]MBL8271802.1 phosphate regulon sensor histidine kinase PhoR [Steroidobacter sp.]
MKKILSAFSPSGWQSVSRLCIALLAAWLLGLALGRVALVLAIVLGIYSIVQLWNVLRVEYWLRNRRVESPPDISGVWGEVVTIISRIYRRKQFHRARVTGLLREFRRLTTAMPEGAVLLGPDHEILWFNGRAGEWLRLRRKRDVGIRIENLVRHPSFVEYLKTGYPSDGAVVEDLETDRWLAFNVVRTGTAERQLLMVRDVSQEQQLQHMRKDFVANASHELRSPLTVISGYLDALADDDALDPAWNSPVLEMRRQAERMRTIIKDLLELSKLESGEHTQEEQPVDMAGMLSLLRKEVMALEAHPRNVRLELQSDALLKGVESELHSIASNLISNAVKYTPVEGEIELRWWVDDDGAHLSVRDTGMGIAEEHIPRLTERFYRVDPGRARSMGGSGLGLAIVKHALQRHDATLQVQSKEGVGSTFTCHFPSARVVARSADVLAIA